MPPMNSINDQYSRWLMKGLVVSAVMVAATTGAIVFGQESPYLQQEQAAEKAAEQAAQISKIIKQQVEDLSKQAKQLQARQGALRGEVRQQCGLSPENVMPTLLRLERERFRLEIEVKLKAARRESLAKLIAEETNRGNERADVDEILEHLKKIVAAREHAAAIQRQSRSAKIATQMELDAAEAEVAEAQIRLALRKQELGKTSTDATIDRLNQQLRDVSMEMTQDELRLKLLNQKLVALGDVQSLLDEYKNSAESELPRVLRLLEQAQTQLSQVEISIVNAPGQ